MNPLARIARTATPSTAIQFRKQAYGKRGVHDFLRDVLAIANASVDGPRYIVTGVSFDQKGRKRLSAVDREDFSGKPAYEALANEHIEPPIRIRYEPVTVDGESIGVFEIGDCQDRPYMMRVDHSEKLRRGDGYVRVNDSAVKMGRRQLQALFEMKFRDSVSTSNIEIGFAGDIIYKDQRVATRNLGKLPSAVASAKLTQLIEAKSRANGSATNSMLARLTHARLFGSDQPYENRSVEDIVNEMQQVRQKYYDHDEHFLFEKNRSDIQLVIFNQSDEPIRGASLSLLMPAHDAFYVATQLPLQPLEGGFVERTSLEQSAYPTVNQRDDALQVNVKIDDIQPGAPVEVFDTPLRICVGNDLKGRKIGLQYKLIAQNLRAPAMGTLRLLF